jgi:hypothetical protein
MTAPNPPTTSSLEVDLTEVYRTSGPPDRLSSAIDRRVEAALKRHRSRPTRSSRRMVLLAATLSLVAALAIAGGAVAQRLASGCGITIEDGISFSDCVVARPGLTNFGEPFWGTDIFDRTPAEAAEMAAAKGYTIRWQIEDRGGTEAFDDDETRFSEEAPDCGAIEAGGVFEAGRIQMVVTMNDPLTPGSAC